VARRPISDGVNSEDGKGGGFIHYTKEEHHWRFKTPFTGLLLALMKGAGGGFLLLVLRTPAETRAGCAGAHLRGKVGDSWAACWYPGWASTVDWAANLRLGH
jgi:hypothetical protein